MTFAGNGSSTPYQFLLKMPYGELITSQSRSNPLGKRKVSPASVGPRMPFTAALTQRWTNDGGVVLFRRNTFA
jgi:hypothetical protein